MNDQKVLARDVLYQLAETDQEKEKVGCEELGLSQNENLVRENSSCAGDHDQFLGRVQLYYCLVEEVAEDRLERPGQSHKSGHQLDDLRADLQVVVLVGEEGQVLDVVESLEDRDQQDKEHFVAEYFAQKVAHGVLMDFLQCGLPDSQVVVLFVLPYVQQSLDRGGLLVDCFVAHIYKIKLIIACRKAERGIIRGKSVLTKGSDAVLLRFYAVNLSIY